MSFDENPADDRYQLDQCIDEIKSLQSQIATLTAERDEARKEVETLKADDKSNAAMSDRCNRVMRVLRDSGNADAESAFWIIAGDARGNRETIARLNAELAALKSAPSMKEVDAAKRACIDILAKIVLARGIEEESKPPQPNPVPSYQELRERIDKLADLARRSIASRDEVVGLLKWLDEFYDFREAKKCLCEYASDKVYGDDQQKARRILEIVEGK